MVAATVTQKSVSRGMISFPDEMLTYIEKEFDTYLESGRYAVFAHGPEEIIRKSFPTCEYQYRGRKMGYAIFRWRYKREEDAVNQYIQLERLISAKVDLSICAITVNTPWS